VLVALKRSTLVSRDTFPWHRLALRKATPTVIRDRDLRLMDGFCAETGTAATLALTIFGRVPVSTTRTITGAILGVGSLKRLSAVRCGVAGRVVWAWILTIPGTAIVSMICWWLLSLLS
jgi:PiT family inorganic phosphate transporter